MPRVTVTINERPYPVVCDEGQEERVRLVASYIDERAREIASAAPGSSEAVVLMLTALTLGDELFEARGGSGTLSEASTENGSGLDESREAQILEALDYLRARVAKIAERLDQR